MILCSLVLSAICLGACAWMATVLKGDATVYGMAVFFLVAVIWFALTYITCLRKERKEREREKEVRG